MTRLAAAAGILAALYTIGLTALAITYKCALQADPDD